MHTRNADFAEMNAGEKCITNGRARHNNDSLYIFERFINSVKYDTHTHRHRCHPPSLHFAICLRALCVFFRANQTYFSSWGFALLAFYYSSLSLSSFVAFSLLAAVLIHSINNWMYMNDANETVLDVANNNDGEVMWNLWWRTSGEFKFSDVVGFILFSIHQRIHWSDLTIIRGNRTEI